MKKLFLPLAACVALASCSKEETMNEANAPLVKKSIPTEDDGILLVVQDFESTYYEWKDENYTPSAAKTIEYEYAIWLVEGTFNYVNRVGAEEVLEHPNYTNPQFYTTTIPVSVENSSGYVSEEDMLALFDELAGLPGDPAPIANLSLTGVSNGNLELEHKRYLFPAAHNGIPYPITGTDNWLAINPGKCNSPSSKNASDRITEAFLYYDYTQDASWYNGLQSIHFFPWSAVPGLSLQASKDFKPCMLSVDMSGNQIITVVGTGTKYCNSFWGGKEYCDGLPSLSPSDCINSTEMSVLANKVDAIYDAESNLIGDPLSGGVSGFQSGGYFTHDMSYDIGLAGKAVAVTL